RVLGLTPRLKTAAGLIEAIAFTSSQQTTQNSSNATPQQFVFDDRSEQLRSQSEMIRPQIHRLILERAGCFQGNGTKAYGIDAMRVFRSNSGQQDNAAQLLDSVTPDVRNHIRVLSDDRIRPELRSFEEKTRSLQRDLDELLREQFDKNEVVSTFKSLVLRI